MEERISSLRSLLAQKLTHAQTTRQLEDLKLEFLGKKGSIQDLMTFLKDVPKEEKPRFGQIINEFKQEAEHLIQNAHALLKLKESEAQLALEAIDVNLPGRAIYQGRVHPLIAMRDKILSIFMEMGFSVVQAPEIDSDYYVFEGLNYPADHPARDMQDTYYVSDTMLLRSHCTNMQLRVMEKHKPPIRVVCPGTVFRNETISARSHVFFHQLDGLYIAKDASFADLFALLNQFLTKLFGKEVPSRFRPSFFPFTEPSLEVDMGCLACDGKGCKICKYSGWLEWTGAGMVHPEVLKNGGIDPEEYAGFAWGLGIERLAMLHYGISDIRMFSENDIRMLSQLRT